MNGSRAKIIRKQVYGNSQPENPGLFGRIRNYFSSKLSESFKVGRTYQTIERVFEVFKKDKNGDPMYDKDGKPMIVKKITRQVVCSGLRAQYKQAKAAWKARNTFGTWAPGVS